MRISINYLENDPVYLGDTKEEEAQNEIKEKLNIKPLRLGYLPEGWKFSSYDINEETEFGILFYTNGQQWLSVYMKKNSDNNVSYYQPDGEREVIETIKNNENIKINLERITSENKEIYAAAFQKDDDCYYCNGDVTYDEMKKIAKYLMILEEKNHK